MDRCTFICLISSCQQYDPVGYGKFYYSLLINKFLSFLQTFVHTAQKLIVCDIGVEPF